MTKSCNDTRLTKFRAHLRAYLDYYYQVTGANKHVEYEPTVHFIWPGKRAALEDVYELHERNVTELMGNRAKLGRMLWYCHLRMQLIPGAILRCPRNDLTFDILWDEELSSVTPSPVPVKVHCSVDQDGVSVRRATYRSGFSVDTTRHVFEVVTLHVRPEQDTWPDGVVVEIECRREQEQVV